VRHLAAPESDGDFDLVSFLQKLLNRLALERQIVLIRCRPHAHFLEQSKLLVLARVALSLFLLKLVFPIVKETADRGNRRWGNFDEVGVTVLGEPQRLENRENAKLLAVLADDPDFPGTDALVDAEIFANRFSPLLDNAMVTSARVDHRSGAQSGLYHVPRRIVNWPAVVGCA